MHPFGVTLALDIVCALAQQLSVGTLPTTPTQARPPTRPHLGRQDVVQEALLAGQSPHELGDGGVQALKHLMNLLKAGARRRVQGLALQSQGSNGGDGASRLRNFQRLVLVRLTKSPKSHTP